MSDTPNHLEQGIKSTGSNAAQPYMTDAVIAGGTAASSDQKAIDRDLTDETGDPLFANPQDSRDKSQAEGRAPDSDLEYKQGGDTSDETGDPIPADSKNAVDQNKPLDERLSGNQR